VAVNVGVHEPVSNGSNSSKERVKNVSLWIDQEGEITQRYQKVHLFDVDVGEGTPALRESDSVEPGSSITPPFKTPVGTVGLMICFDLRFPELSTHLLTHYPNNIPSILTYPSAFTAPTGKVHWLPLLQARAIETQCYVVAAAQVGNHNEKRVSYGHSTVIGPWGEVLVELGGEWEGEPEVAVVDVDEEAVKEARRRVPLRRRWDVYGQP
jgi:deaminated glutathione amidase